MYIIYVQQMNMFYLYAFQEVRINKGYSLLPCYIDNQVDKFLKLNLKKQRY